MHIIHIISLLSTLSWLFLPFTQRDSKYFYYFLLMAITGLYSAVVFTFHLGPPYKIVLATSVLTVPALFKDFFSRHKTVLFVIGLLIYLVFYKLSGIYAEWIGIILDITVLIIMSIQIIKNVIHTNEIRIVWIVLLVYHFSLLLKYLILLTEPDQNTGIVLFFVTTIFQILVGVFLLFAREENPKLIVELK